MIWKRNAGIIITVAFLILSLGIVVFLLNAWMPSASVHKVITTRRSIRRFQDRPISESKIRKILIAASYAPSSGNLQPWEFIVVKEEKNLKEVFKTLKWLEARGVPTAESSPTCYIIILGNKDINKDYQIDCAMACQNILLAAWAEGVGYCPIGAIDRASLKELLLIPRHLDIFLVVALGYPAEAPFATMAHEGEDVQPQLRPGEKLEVPKKPLESMFHKERYSQK